MEDIRLLKNLNLFKGLATLDVVKISKLVRRVNFEKGQDVVKEGTACDSIFFVKEGSVSVIRQGRKIASIGVGHPVGEVSFVDKGLRSATVVANADCTLLKVPVSALERLMKEDKDMANKIYKSLAVTLAERLRDTNDSLLLTKS
ncbi:MAG: hypothetical protein COZ31_04450 [Nitrospirae bacterium CG_4_10_14_3_um_filter_44_29]|nr:cyclic nucleotide-binding domain-containing protein [Nitrospirota bacterium]OIO29318.1 MAG: hypothetical protein AUJ60_05335 [Nitrospirae bacterium CG1_02_44_142]PIP70204.1 MAG: hypothetical protein COW90_06535 [Nitrospirae bacterium CG22_combo_CG10-13_8_21_14_all_44_11]PIV41984.1 MAG: hypothetical protein COS28_04245 [Nitrospirae bacterium CG02_land_8_20_14_3_00_44_33]PIV65812.1 MAG: hypothetical protein COS10_09495 [Nitrospirae bacterium CG01_land_8_20_14_3_00_44_22]PIW88796.1 MAG: hypoth